MQAQSRSTPEHAPLLKTALTRTVVVPPVVMAVGWRIAKRLARIPLLGWLLGTYVLAFALVGVVCAVVLAPLVFVVMVPLTAFVGRDQRAGASAAPERS